jgi:hypothetical protein
VATARLANWRPLPARLQSTIFSLEVDSNIAVPTACSQLLNPA